MSAATIGTTQQAPAQAHPTFAQWKATQKNRFRVRVGKHIAKEPLFDEKGNAVVDMNKDSRNYGKQVTVNRIYQARTDHDIIETDKDLVAIFNGPGSEKFERVHDDDHRQSAPAPLPVYQSGHNQHAFTPAGPVPVAPTATDTYEAMTVKELQAHAAAEEISLPDHLTKPNAKKEDVIKALRASAPR